MVFKKITSDYIEHIKSRYNALVPIDYHSLTKYISTTPNKKFKSIALDIKNCSIFIDGMWYMPEIHTEKDSGKIHSSEFCIGNVPFEVKKAALGVCNQYVIPFSSLSIFTSICKNASVSVNVPNVYTESIDEFIQSPDEIIKNISIETKIDEYKIKQLMYSCDYLSSSQKFLDTFEDEDLLNLTKNTTFSLFFEDYYRITLFLPILFKNKEFHLMLNKVYKPIINNKKRSKHEMLTWIHENVETYIINKLINFVDKLHNTRPLLVSGNEIYYKHVIPVDTFIEFNKSIKEEFQFVRMRHYKLFPNTRVVLNEELENEITEHKKRIQNEEKLAKQWAKTYRNAQEEYDNDMYILSKLRDDYIERHKIQFGLNSDL